MGQIILATNAAMYGLFPCRTGVILRVVSRNNPRWPSDPKSAKNKPPERAPMWFDAGAGPMADRHSDQSETGFLCCVLY